jgi:hypothetical protein
LATGILRVKLLSMREPDSAGREAELAHEVCARCDAWDRGAVAAWLRRTGSPRPPHTDLAEPYRLQVAGDWEAAPARHPVDPGRAPSRDPCPSARLDAPTRGIAASHAARLGLVDTATR